MRPETTRPVRVHTFIRVHDNMPEHPKIECLSDKAFRHIVSLWCYCSRQLNDGGLSEQSMRRRTTPATLRELIAARLVDRRDDGTYEVHDYLDHQRSREAAEALTAKRSEAGAKGGRAKAERLASATANAIASATANTKQPRSREEKRREEKNKNTPNPLFDAFWRTYPRRVSRPSAERAWQAATRKASPDVIMAGLSRHLPTWRGQEAKFIPHPATWLNGERWADEITTPEPEHPLGPWARLPDATGRPA